MLLEIITIISVVLNIALASTSIISEAIGLSTCKNNTIIELIVPQISKRQEEEKKEEKNN